MKKFLKPMLNRAGKTKQDSQNSPLAGTPFQQEEIEFDLLEPRVLFSAAPVEPAPETQVEESAQTPADSNSDSGQGSSEADQAGSSTSLSEESLQAVADAAADRWRASGISAEQEAALDALTYSIGSLANPTLATYGDGAIVIDDDGAGRGWFVDETAGADEEFAASGQALSGSAAEGRMDLLTILMHEQGHALGLVDTAFGTDDVMSDYLQTGSRHLPESGQATEAIPGTIDTVETAGATIVVDGGGGGDHTTIAAAVAAASSGDIIMVNNGTYNENVNLSSFSGDLTIQATNALGASWNDGGQAASSSGNSANIRISGFDLGTTVFTDVSGVITLDGNRIDNYSSIGVSVLVSGSTQMGIHLFDNDFDTASASVQGILVDTTMNNSSGLADVVVDGNTFTGLQNEGIFIGPINQLTLTAGEINARIVNNVFSGRTGFGTDIQIFGGSNVSNNLVVSALIDNNRTNLGGAPANVQDALKFDIDGTNTTINAIITNNNFNHHNDGLYFDADSTTLGSTFNAIIADNTINDTEEEGIHLRPFSDPVGARATWNFTLTGNILTNINSDLSTGHAGIEIETDNTSDDDYTFNLDLSGNDVSMAAGSPSSSYVVDANSTSGATVFIERDIASNNTGSVTIDDPGGIVTMPSANALADSAEPRTISGTVFHDSNGDGDQTGEAGVAGVAVTLTGTAAAGGAVSMTTFTDKDGNYAFPAVIPPNGSGYTLTVGTTTDFGFYTTQDAVADNIDSDVDSTTGQFTVNFSGLGAAIDVDAGLSATAPATTTDVNLSVDINSGSENAGTVVTVTATADSAVSGNQTVDLGVSGTNITSGDYSLSNATITILDGMTTGSVTFTIVDDNVFESDETATLTISNPSAGLSLGSTTSQNIAITDNESVTLSLNPTTYSPNEGDGTFNAVVQISGIPAGGLEVAIPAILNSTDGTAISGDDYTAVVNLTQNFPTSSVSNDTMNFSITILEDGDLEGPQDFTLTLSSSLSGVVIGADTATVTIVDNEIAENIATVDGGGNAVVRSDDGRDTIEVTTDGTGNLVISTPDDSIVGGAGTTTNGNGDILIPLAGLTSLTIHSGGDKDTINIEDLTGFTGALDIDGGDGHDQINFEAEVTLGADNDASLAAEIVSVERASITTQGSGSIVIDATGSGDGSGSVIGLDVRESDLIASGSGSIMLSGQGGIGSGGDAAGNEGVRLQRGSTVSTADGDIEIDGTGGRSNEGTNRGVTVLSEATVSAGGSGNLTITGAATGSEGRSLSYNDGVYVASQAVLSTENGTLTIMGTAGGNADNNDGVELSSDSVVRTSGSGNIIIEGTGSGGNSGDLNNGVKLNRAAVTALGTGSITIRGTSGAGNDKNMGVDVASGSSVVATGGDILIEGTSRGGANNGKTNIGVRVHGSSEVETEGSGELTVRGTGSETDEGTSNNDGVLLVNSTLRTENGNLVVEGTGGGDDKTNRGINGNGSTVEATGTGNVMLTGSGTDVGTGANNDGVYLKNVTARSVGGALTMVGNGGSGTKTNVGVRISGGTLSAGGGALSITGSANGGTSQNGNYGVWVDSATMEGVGGNSIVGTGGGGTSGNHGVYLEGITTGSLAPGDVTGTAGLGTGSEETYGDFFP